MRILIYGAGVIGSLYAALFAEAGYDMANEYIGNAVGKYMRIWRWPGANKRCGHKMLQKSRIKSRKI